MSLFQSISLANDANSFEDLGRQMQLPDTPDMWGPVDNSIDAWVDRFNQVVNRPRFDAKIDGFISPFSTDHWGASADIMQGMAARFESLAQDKVDPNKIFTADMAQLKTIQANHAKITKMFEHCLAEALTEKGKVGLTEDEIAAMQALNSANATLTNITKEQIAVRKAIAELKIKQQQVGGPPGQAGAPTGGGRAASAFDVGRAIMDDIFTTVPGNITEPQVVGNYPSMDPSQAENVLNNIVAEATVSDAIRNEAAGPTTYVVVDRNGQNPEFVTYSADGQEMVDYENPRSTITDINPETGFAQDDLMQEYPIKIRQDLAGI